MQKVLPSSPRGSRKNLACRGLTIYRRAKYSIGGGQKQGRPYRSGKNAFEYIMVSKIRLFLQSGKVDKLLKQLLLDRNA